MVRVIASPHIFISYSRKDSDFVLPLVDSLQDTFKSAGISLFFDRDSKPLADPESLEVGLSAGLSTAKIFLPCASANYLNSTWCVKELTAFFWRYLAEQNATIEEDAPLAPRFASSWPLYCLPLVPGSDDAYEATRCFGLLELALLKESTDPIRSLENIRSFLASGGKLFYRAGLTSVEFARQVGAYIQNLLSKPLEIEEELSPVALWKNLWRRYGSPRIGENIDPIVLLKGFSIAPSVIRKTQARIELYADEGLVELFLSLSSGRMSTVAFDRWNTMATLDETPSRLAASSMIGDPLALMIAQVRNRPMLQALQYSYYAFSLRYGQVLSVDVCAVASLTMNMHSWYERVYDGEAIRANILSFLIEGTDIAEGIAA